MNHTVKTLWTNVKSVFLVLGSGMLSTVVQTADRNGQVPDLIGHENTNQEELSEQVQDELLSVVERWAKKLDGFPCDFIEFLDTNAEIDFTKFARVVWGKFDLNHPKLFSLSQITTALGSDKGQKIMTEIKDKMEHLRKVIFYRVWDLKGIMPWDVDKFMDPNGNLEKISNADLFSELRTSCFNHKSGPTFSFGCEDYCQNYYEKPSYCQFITDSILRKAWEQAEIKDIKKRFLDRVQNLYIERLSYPLRLYITYCIKYKKSINCLDKDSEIQNSKIINLLSDSLRWHWSDYNFFPPESKILELLEQGRLGDVKKKLYLMGVVENYVGELPISELAKFLQEDGNIACTAERFAEVSWKRFFRTKPCNPPQKKLLISTIQNKFGSELEEMLRNKVSRLRECLHKDPERIRPVAEVGKKGEGIENKEEMGEE